MTAYVVGQGGRVGLYSTGLQWSTIIGTTPTTSNLAGRLDWLATGTNSLTAAKSYCTKPALTPGGHVTLAQYVVNGLDRDYNCG
jgi:hypothetical protein